MSLRVLMLNPFPAWNDLTHWITVADSNSIASTIATQEVVSCGRRPPRAIYFIGLTYVNNNEFISDKRPMYSTHTI